MVLNFWYPSCPPCREEMPAFEAAWQELKDGPVRFLGLYVPQGFDSEQNARDFVDELRHTRTLARRTLSPLPGTPQGPAGFSYSNSRRRSGGSRLGMESSMG